LRKIVWICEVALAASSTPGQSPGQQAASKAAAARLVSDLVAVFGVTSDGTLVEGAPPPDWAPAEMRTVLFRSLAVLPFPASAAAPSHGVVRLLGTVFDRVTAKARRLRPVANAWVGFAGAAVSSMLGTPPLTRCAPSAADDDPGAAARRCPAPNSLPGQYA
jgi:hypothetical protein